MIEIKPEKLKNETDEEYSMFLSYVGDCAPNPARSIEKVAAKFCLPVQDVREISINKLWGARAAQFDIQYVKDRASAVPRTRGGDPNLFLFFFFFSLLFPAHAGVILYLSV